MTQLAVRLAEGRRRGQAAMAALLRVHRLLRAGVRGKIRRIFRNRVVHVRLFVRPTSLRASWRSRLAAPAALLPTVLLRVRNRGRALPGRRARRLSRVHPERRLRQSNLALPELQLRRPRRALRGLQVRRRRAVPAGEPIWSLLPSAASPNPTSRGMRANSLLQAP